ncbi:hypothetical protein Lbir_2977 [Legionella birminghamensis]|uniref:Uncharacterized protein n=1 Tax=Legionella birminghamensis TaxID=28083 RepID=A0A378I6W4_9GAMM|nr:hypothetical protein [Legionella birminghamensis]KTC68375.1 hypothetical protein Lbir_2977 [Legionella birminghamensis]STX30909.1 Uncharacterised protein [Legionella birminghamensis]
MRCRMGCIMTLFLSLASTSLCYGYGYNRQWGTQVIIVNPNTVPNQYYNSYPYYPSYPQYYYYPRYRCIVVPRCYPSGSCNYQNQECGYF